MATQSEHSGWFKWTLGAVIALLGAGGGLVAVLKYLDDRSIAAERKYQEALAAWEAFAPSSISLGSQEAEVEVGECLDLDLGRMLDFLADDRDLCFHRWPDEDVIALSAHPDVLAADLGVVDFSQISYRAVRDAPFVEIPSFEGGLPFLFRSKVNRAPRSGYTYALRLPSRRVAKVQILKYEERPHERIPNLSWARVHLRYEVLPITPDPPRPRRR